MIRREVRVQTKKKALGTVIRVVHIARTENSEKNADVWTFIYFEKLSEGFDFDSVGKSSLRRWSQYILFPPNSF